VESTNDAALASNELVAVRIKRPTEQQMKEDKQANERVNSELGGEREKEIKIESARR